MKKYTIVALIAFAFLVLRSNDTKKAKLVKTNEVEKEVITTKKKTSKIEEIIERKIENIEEQLIKHTDLRAKAIKSAQEKELLESYFTDSKNIRLAYLVLKNSNFENMDKAIDRRIEAVNFLIEGIKKTTIDRAELIKTTEMFLLSDLEERTSDKEVKRAIVGDKVELYHALLKFAPKQAKRFKENYMSERLKNVIHYVELNLKRENRG